jgi:hypothetical protein
MDRRDFIRLGLATGTIASAVTSSIASANTGAANIILHVQFDIGQASQQLNWYFSDARGKIEPKATGIKSGALAFRAGDSLGLAISVESEAGRLENARIVDCALITLPLANTWEMPNPGHYPMPSPFYQSESGPGVISSFMPVSSSAASSHRQTFNGQNLIINNHGRYKLTFMMTVAITESSGVISHRVFYFDPEADVGTGLE